jgi:hypothetical protein
MNTDMTNPDDELIQEMKIEELKKMVQNIQFETYARTSEIVENPEETEHSNQSDFFSANEQN